MAPSILLLEELDYKQDRTELFSEYDSVYQWIQNVKKIPYLRAIHLEPTYRIATALMQSIKRDRNFKLFI